ncbi:hypothetical protein ZORO111902_09555 [Zobellia roscoffensis]
MSLNIKLLQGLKEFYYEKVILMLFTNTQLKILYL